jgi:ribosomal protein L29
MQQAPNPMRIRHIRKMVARIHTELAQRERKAANA